MSELWNQLQQKFIEMKTLIENEGVIVPDGFSKEDVNLEAPKLWDNGFDNIFCRILKEISMSMYVLHFTMSYRQDIIKLYRDITEITEVFYGHLLSTSLIETFIHVQPTLQ